MGTDKARLEVDGRTFADWVRRAVAGLPTVVVGAEHSDLRSLPDADGSGPTSGLAAAMRLEADAILLVAVDQPWLRTETVTRLAERFDDRAVVPVADGIRQVTCAIYPTDLLPTAIRLASEGRALQAVLDGSEVDEVHAMEWKAWGEDGRSWFGADTPQDVAEGLHRFGPPGS